MAKLYFFFAPMSAGKSTHLLQANYNYTSNNGQTLLLTSHKDNRHSVGLISSRLGLQLPATPFLPSTNLYDLAYDWLNLPEVNSTPPKLRAIFIDEAQFLSHEQVLQLHQVAHTLNVAVLCYGLRSSFKLTPFQGSASLMALADTLTELKTICQCGSKATLNLLHNNKTRITHGSDVAIENDQLPGQYSSSCGQCLYTQYS